MGQHVIRRENLGVPQSARDVFALLAQGGWIDAVLAGKLKRRVGFRNIAVHDYQARQLPILICIIETLWMSFWNTVRRCCWVMLLRQKSKHETCRRRGTPVSKSHEDYEME
ncbi:MAG: DUF86 domain-containing protein [Nitrosomonas sp.]|nr:DUF86 domain-containing protein [Nitrosomonas sp.]